MHTDHIKMFYDIGELNNLFAESMTVEAFLQKIVEMVARHMNAGVCSIYLYDDAEDELVLKANVGLNPDSINNIKLKSGEGLVGYALKELKPVCEKCGSDNPNFKLQPGIGEESFKSFLAVPITRGAIRIGVLVVQRKEGMEFVDNDIMALRATASQLASMIENIKFIISPYRAKKISVTTDLNKLKFIKGKKASDGYAYNKVIIIDRESISNLSIDEVKFSGYSIDDFNRAVKATEEQLEQLQEKIEEKLSDAASMIFSAHLLMLKDKSFTGAISDMIKSGENPGTAILKKYNEFRNIFLKSPSPLIKEKVQDIEDLAKRILDNLDNKFDASGKYREMIAVARDIYPSDLLTMSAEGVTGIILVSGGVTSHVSILARSLKIPVVIADMPELLDLPADAMALVDAEIGNIYINPSNEILSKFKEREIARAGINKDESEKLPAVTADGVRIKLMVNINLLSDIKNIEDINNDGIGLYRTEFPFIIRNDFPTEEEQFVIYSKLINSMRNKPVTFRTLDIGGDKVLSYYQVAKEENPFLGMRSIRFSLTHKDIFKQQIRAILRAGKGSNVRIMFPMISSIDDFILSRDIVFECVGELESEGTEHLENPEVGAMIEIPSAVNIIEDLAQEADFLSIGTNDLIQYTLAVDRTNEKVADLYIPHHPAILRSLKRIADAAISHNKDLSICGDMANDKRYIPFLIGAGIRILSVDSAYLSNVKKILAGINLPDAEKKAALMLSKNKISDLNQIIENQN